MGKRRSHLELQVDDRVLHRAEDRPADLLQRHAALVEVHPRLDALLLLACGQRARRIMGGEGSSADLVLRRVLRDGEDVEGALRDEEDAAGPLELFVDLVAVVGEQNALVALAQRLDLRLRQEVSDSTIVNVKERRRRRRRTLRRKFSR